nr:Survival motor neuron-like protein 1 [Colletotrichum truncatum]KAF6796021.1 Survival motor neuron-like protein 1 [Colletotrichum truncatum]
MAGKNVELSHAEMWDDSALIDSWNEALDEYKTKKSTLTHSHRHRTHGAIDPETEAVDRSEIMVDGEAANETKEVGGSTDVKQPIHPRENPGRSEKLGICYPASCSVNSKRACRKGYLEQRWRPRPCDNGPARSSRFSTGRRTEETFDVMVLRWILHRIVRRAAADTGTAAMRLSSLLRPGIGELGWCGEWGEVGHPEKRLLES